MKSRISRSGVILLSLAAAIFVPLSFGQRPVSKLEYEIYGTVLRRMDRRYREEHKGESQFYLILQGLSDHNETDPPRDNKRRFTLKFPGAPDHSIVDRSEIDGLIKRGVSEYRDRIAQARLRGEVVALDMCGESGWKYFYTRYPGSDGYYRFSDIRFSRGRNRASIVVRGTGSSWESLETYTLSKSRRGWRVQTISGGGGIC